MNSRVIFILLCFILGLLAALFGHPLVRGNSDAITIIITVMTVFAGFLVAIISILGDPAMIAPSSWRAAQATHMKLEARILQHTTLFYVYLIAIGFLFIGVLIDKEPDQVVSENVKAWIAGIYVFFGVFSFLLTLALPHTLGKIQISRGEAETERRRAAAGITPPNL